MLGVLGNANLYLINPNGILFGENASLDVNGSFFATTADSVLFKNGFEFSAANPNQPPLLTIDIPIGLKFRDNPGDIVNRSVANEVGLQVDTGKTLALMGGEINFEGGRIIAPGSNIELGGLLATGTIIIEDNFEFSFPEGVERADVTLTNSAEVNVSAAGGGDMTINARNLELFGGELGRSLLLAGITSDSGSLEAQAGDIILNATDIIIVQESAIANQVAPTGIGNSGDINITATDLSLIQGGRLSAGTFGKGNAGAININASNTIFVDGEDLAGINSGIFSTVTDTGIGNSGGINITTTDLLMTRISLLNASTSRRGNAGSINIDALGTISIGGEDFDGIPSGIFSQVLPTGIGNSGGINITTTDLALTQGSVVNASTFGQGDSGVITINALNTISIDGEDFEGFSSAIFSTVTNTGKGKSGGISITTTDLSLTNEARISVQSLGQGNPDDLFIRANSLTLSNGAFLLASTPVDTGGSMFLTIDDLLTLRNNSTISAQAFNNANGGNIDIDTKFIIAFPNQNNDIIASASQGRGGEINIATEGIFGLEERRSTPPNETNDIDASSEFGLSGTVNITQPDVNPTSGLLDLTEEVVNASDLIAQNVCTQTANSEFVDIGKGGLPQNPEYTLVEDATEVELVAPVTVSEKEIEANRETEAVKPQKTRKPPAQGWIWHENGIVELVAYNPERTGEQRTWDNHRGCQD